MAIYCKRENCVYCCNHSCKSSDLTVDETGNCASFIMNEAVSAMTLEIVCDPYDLDAPVGLIIRGNTVCHEQLLISLGYSVGQEPNHGLWSFLQRNRLCSRCWRISCSFEEAEKHIADTSELGLKVENYITEEIRSVWEKAKQRASMTDEDRQRALSDLAPPEVPFLVKGKLWNGKVYTFKNGYAIYLDGEQVNITNVVADELRRYLTQRSKYENRRNELRVLA